MEKRTRIGHVSLFYPPVGGGAEIYLERLVRSLEHFEQLLWTLTPEGHDAGSSADGELSIEYFGQCPPIDYQTLGAWFEESHREIFDGIRRWVDRNAPDLLIVNSPLTYFPPIRRLIRDLRRICPVGCILHDVSGPSFSALLEVFRRTGNWETAIEVARPELEALIRSANPPPSESPFHLETDFTIYNSAWLRRLFDPHGERRSIVMHPLAHRTDDRPEVGLAPVDLTIVNPIPMKGGALFLELASFHFRDHRIRILGGGYNSAMGHLEPYLHRVQSGLYRSGIPENIEVLGRVHNMTEVYRNTTVLLHPSRIDSYGLTPAEALLEGCLVATTDLPGIVEGVGDAALKLPYFADARAWSDGIARMIETRDRWREAASHRARYLMARQAKEIVALEEFLEATVG